MKIITALILSIGIMFFLSASQKMVSAEEFPLASKMWQATIIKIEGINTSKALAVGEVRRENAKEYCDRDPGGETIEYGGKLTKGQCIQKILKKEKDKLYSACADCPRKTITTSCGETFSPIGIDQFGGYIWRNIHSGQILDGSSASGAPVVDFQFKMLCPAFAKP